MKQLHCILPRAISQLICVAALILLALPVRATLIMTLSGSPDSPIVNVSFSGSATVQAAVNVNVVGFGWDFAPTTFDPFPPQITDGNFGSFYFPIQSAQFLNVTRNQPSVIGGVWLQDSSNSAFPGWERFGILDSRSYTYTVGDIYQWSGSGTIDLSSVGLTFGSLNLGDTGPIFPLGPVIAGVLEGELRIVVPEPSSVLLLGVAALGGVLRRVSKRGEKQRC